MDKTILDQIISLSKEYHSDALIIIQNDTLVYEDFYDKEDIPRYISSAGKSITGLAIGKLLDLKLIDSLDLPVHALFPEWRQGKKRDVTIKMLLNHTSGLQNYSNASLELEPPPDYKVDDVIKLALSAELSNTPGTHFSYNNKAVALLGGIVEKASGLPFDTFVAKYFYEPMNIDQYDWIKDRSGNATTHGAFVITAKDFMKFGQLMLHNGMYNKEQIISKSWVSQSTQSSTDLYKKSGLLWWLLPKYHKRIIDQELINLWKSKKPAPSFLKKIAPIFHQEFETNALFHATLREFFGANYYAEMSRNLGQDTLWAQHIISDEIMGFYAEGYRGNWLVVIPKYQLVAIRMADHDGFELENGDSFEKFPSLITQLFSH